MSQLSFRANCCPFSGGFIYLYNDFSMCKLHQLYSFMLTLLHTLINNGLNI